MKIMRVSVSTAETKEGWLYDQGAVVIDGLWFYQDVSSDESVNKLRKLAERNGVEFIDNRRLKSEIPITRKISPHGQSGFSCKSA